MKRSRRLMCLLMTVVLIIGSIMGEMSVSAAKSKAKVKVGSKITSGNYKYQVLSLKGTQGTASLTGVKSKKIKTVNMPKTVKSGQYTLEVVAIGNNAFKGCKNLQKVQTNNSIRTIGKNAFNGCKNLKKLTINSTKLSQVGSNALKGVTKAVVEVPESKGSAYNQMLKGKGQKSIDLKADLKVADATPQTETPAPAAAPQTEAPTPAAAPQVKTPAPAAAPQAAVRPDVGIQVGGQTGNTQTTPKVEPTTDTEAPETKAPTTEAPVTETETEEETETTEAQAVVPETKAEIETTEAPVTEAETEKETETTEATEPQTEAETEPQTQATEPETQAPMETEPEHVHNTEWVRVDPNYCYFKQVCIECGEEIGLREKRHEMEPYSEPATCTTAGKEGSKCKVCGEVNFHYTKELGHEYETIHEEATCVKGETTYEKCVRCGATTDPQTISEAKGHDWVETEIPVTCTEDGFSGKICSVCGAREGIETPAIGHKYEETRIEPTCEEDGEVKQVCSVCNDTIVTVIPAVADEHNWVKYPEKKANCSEDGHSAYEQCSICGAYKDGEPKIYKSTGEHSWEQDIELCSALSLAEKENVETAGNSLKECNDHYGLKDAFQKCEGCGMYRIVKVDGGHHWDDGDQCSFKTAAQNSEVKANPSWEGKIETGGYTSGTLVHGFIQGTAYLVKHGTAVDVKNTGFRPPFEVQIGAEKYDCYILVIRSNIDSFAEHALKVVGEDVTWRQLTDVNGKLSDQSANEEPFYLADGNIYMACAE